MESQGAKPNAFEKAKTNEYSKIKKVVGIMSGKGGVGKSSVTALTAITLNKKGFRVGILDADITGPSIPKIFGLNSEKAAADDKGIYPEITATGIKVMSINLLLDKKDHPVVWRGPIVSNTVKQFFTDVVWGELDYLLIDLPPGTGDVPLTIMQSIPLNGIITVSSPQDLVKLIVTKSVNMAKMLKVPIFGIVENMSYFECPHCHERVNIFGESRIEEVAEEMKLKVLAKMPVDPELAQLCDAGKVEEYEKVEILPD
ncbi:MAG: Mrp/NBP35 family ATP-binding protein [Desulfitobacteriaceae bacterium]|nr:Mrp/NBP35 family ATP-binding protein [Desulfitobacteriaceae bacterium]MDD4752607.1 Mrp/NBP35 family ATP-binding protein [Desulfitobacteriaceae bacterium]